LEWATSNVAMKEFTTHDVYDQVHSALSSEQTSDALRRLYKEGKLNRKEFMDGNRKKFIYSLSNAKVSEQVSADIERDVDYVCNQIKVDKEITKVDNKPQQIEIPNNFSIELKTPSGFVITIKSSDLKDNK
jgi:hypothetical protein